MRRKTVLRLLVSRWGNFSPVVKQIMSQDEPVIEAEHVEMPSDENIVVTKEVKSQDELMKELGYQAEA